VNLLVSDSWGEVGPEAIERGIGGREGAMLHLSKEWADQGHEVTNFVNVETTSRFEGIDNYDFSGTGYHQYTPLNLAKSYLQNFKNDVVIAWEMPSIFDDEDIRKNSGLKLCEMQVCHLSDKEMISAGKNLDYMCALSQWHKNFLLYSGLDMSEEKVKIFPNGIDQKRYKNDEILTKMGKKVPKNAKFVYSSSPDRGLWYLLQIWPYLREEYPEATLSVCYGLEKWLNQVKWMHGRIAEMALGIEELLQQPGIKNLGKIGQDQLSKLQIEADAWLYPFDPMSPTESGCITAIENAAAGNAIVTTDADCMEDEFGGFSKIIPLPFNAEEFAEKTITYLNDTPYVEYNRTAAKAFSEKRNWEVISKQWTQFFYDQN
jgi:glycosyltransferase involved in cell wall biosynthesis